MSAPFPAGEHEAWITLSRYRTWAVGRIVYQASVVSRNEAYSHFGDDPGIVTEWMEKRERDREVVSENETRERGLFRISIDGDGVISILAELADAETKS